MSWTVTPQADAEGNVVGFESEQHREGYHRFTSDDFVEFQDGSVHHAFENVELNEDTDISNEELYIEALHEVYPSLADAVDWAATEMPKDFIDGFNAAVDSDDTDQLHGYIQALLQHYNDFYGTEEPQEDASNSDEVETDTELTQEVFDEAVAALTETEPQGEELANDWQAAVDSYREAGDETAAGIAAAVAAFHGSQVSAQEAIQWVIDNYDIQDVARVYKSLNA
jgi:hypothetical protein